MPCGWRSQPGPGRQNSLLHLPAEKLISEWTSPFLGQEMGPLIYIGWNHYMLFLGLLLSGKWEEQRLKEQSCFFFFSHFQLKQWILDHMEDVLGTFPDYFKKAGIFWEWAFCFWVNFLKAICDWFTRELIIFCFPLFSLQSIPNFFSNSIYPAQM